MRVFAVYNIKGGVGKTATAVNFAHLSAREGSRTLVWDLDPQGAASFYFRVKARVKGGGRRLIRRKNRLAGKIRGTDYEFLDLLPADFSYRHFDLFLSRKKKPLRRLEHLLRPLGDSYDHVILDCPPSISLISESVFAAADALVVPTIPTTLSMRTLEQLRDHVSSMRKPRRPAVLPFFCMVDLRKSLHREICGRRDGDDGFLKTQVPYASAVERMGVHRAPLLTFAPRSAAAVVYRQLWKEVCGLVPPFPREERL